MEDWKIEEMDEKIQQLHKIAEELKGKAGGIQAVERNLDRILANIKMLELNISDVKELV
ncbi:MAG: hypothetical protein JRI46_00955 [Deltaproteobacteria bacterium]|nr:hypothetical protein [Deltaproteobacteria bacterium]